MLTRARRVLGAFFAATTGVLLTAIGTPTAGAADNPIPVNLGVHQFGQLSTADAVVLRASASQVGFSHNPGEDIWGPWSFQVMPDGTLWLLDEVNGRLQSWRPERPGQPTGTVPLEPPATWDFVIAPDGSLYYISPLGGRTLHAADAAGRVRWRAPVTMDGPMRIGPDGTVYVVDPAEGGWTPVTTADRKPLPVADQIRLTRKNQPLPGGGSLAVAWAAAQHRVDVALLDAAGRTVRAWRITSTTDIEGTAFVPTVVNGDPVIGISTYQYPPDGSVLLEQLILRLTATGAAAPLVVVNHTFGSAVTALRTGPDGAFYQLTSDLSTGVTVSRFTLPGLVPPAPPGGGVVPASPTAGPTTAAPSAPAAVVPTAATPAPPGAATPASPASPISLGQWLLIGGGALLVLLVAGGTVLLMWRRRRAAPPATSEPEESRMVPDAGRARG